MDVPDFVPRESHHILFRKGDTYYVIDDESWKAKRNRLEFEREGLLPHWAQDILDHGHLLDYRPLCAYNSGYVLQYVMMRHGRIFEDKCIYCEAAEHGIPFQKIRDVSHFNQDEWIKELECLWLEYGGEAGANVKPAKQ